MSNETPKPMTPADARAKLAELAAAQTPRTAFIDAADQGKAVGGESGVNDAVSLAVLRATDFPAILATWDAMARVCSLIDQPEIADFLKGVQIEAAHQKVRWGDDHDKRKMGEDWYWTVGYVAGKALRSMRDGDWDKAKHHLITSAAITANWFRMLCDELAALTPKTGSAQ